MSPTVSIIIPIYNAEKYVRNCVDSILRQTFTDFEIILVDDGSTDSSGRIVDELAVTDNRIKVIHQENGGPGKARNTGIENAKGTFVNFVDADDLLEEDLLSSYQRVNSTYDICFQGYIGFSEKESHVVSLSPKNSNNNSYEDVVLEMLTNGMLGYVCCKQFRLNIIKENHLRFRETVKYREDFLFTIEYLTYCQSACITGDSGYRYRLDNPNSLLHTWFDAEEYLSVNRSVFETAIKNWNTFPRLTNYFRQWYADSQYKGIRGLIRKRKPGKEERNKERHYISEMIDFYKTTSIGIPYSNNALANRLIKMAWQTRNVDIVHNTMRILIR